MMPNRHPAGMGLLVALLLAGCQGLPAPEASPEQKLQLGLGMTLNPRSLPQAEQVLRRAGQDFAARQDLSGQAQVAFALGELYKSKPWQALQKPPATVAFYQQAAQQYQQAARLYGQLQRPALQGAAQVGAANAWLLADDVGQACPAYQQAQTTLRDPATQRDTAGYAQLQRGVAFFADLGTVCQIQQQLSQLAVLPVPRP